MGHGSLRVWNDDEIAPNHRLSRPSHANMEIITYVREGAITHTGQSRHKGRTEAGDVQVIERRIRRASLRNIISSDQDKILPDLDRADHGRRPADWGAKPFPKSDRSGNFVTIASGYRSRQGQALPIRADARVLATTLKAGESAEYAPGKTRNSIWFRRRVRSRSTA